MADARVDCRGRPDARAILAADAALSGRGRARPGRRARHDRPRRAGRGRHDRSHGRGSRRYAELNDATVIAHVARPGGGTLDGAAAVDRRARRPVSRHVRQAERRGVRGHGRRDRAAAKSSAAASRSFAPRRARRSISTRRCTRRPLKRIAEETGGRFYTPDSVAGIAEDVRYAGRGVTSVEERPLWNMPIVLIALMGLCARSGATGAPWAWRERLRT